MLVKRTSLIAGTQVLAQILAGLTYLLGARSLGPYVFGQYATVIAVSNVVVLLFDFGLNALLVRELASGSITHEEAFGVVRRKQLCALLPIAITGSFAYMVLRDAEAAVALGAMTWLMWEAQTANALLRARELFSRSATGQTVGRFCALGAFLILQERQMSGGLPIALALGWAVEAFCDALLGRQLGSVPRLGFRYAAGVQKSASAFGLTSLAASAQQLDTPIVSVFGSVEIAGLYAAAGRLLGPLGFLSNSLVSVATPLLARARHDTSELQRAECQVWRIGLVLFPAPLVAAVFGPWLIPILLGDAFAPSGGAFAVLAIGACVATISQIGAVMLQNRRRLRLVAITTTAGLLSGFVVTAALARYGAAEAAVGYVVCQLMMATILGLSLQKIRRIQSAVSTREGGRHHD